LVLRLNWNALRELKGDVDKARSVGAVRRGRQTTAWSTNLISRISCNVLAFDIDVDNVLNTQKMDTHEYSYTVQKYFKYWNL